MSIVTGQMSLALRASIPREVKHFSTWRKRD